ncbi:MULTISPECIES: helix-turn-helix domain-containing protein [Elizabethkingia]|uniref:helix-turn-helix domain-containing protein n=1 Tax=Elizabethkingia TaxID=308865 RepID=UPI00099959B1|nr:MULTISPECIES: helix-turn-helix transcriptional regulator [Elizabethkingia]AQX90582.1 XRE family transcriptional regulator [Elizabethkingia anophelis]EHM7981730.1 helix-turn-helix transcriptional regulator [Elizabethkingia anophelis]EHM8032228.1 helix-turn-helix transcriptional regulator [Elizabethkingia anophelis]EHZ9535182.1 helix-turn-helix transcriptional regulator [Elizabethkingia anophelis]EKU3673092.1 helix-turn-helix transcriptional regulator [Elizabethkingia anophelis]
MGTKDEELIRFGIHIKDLRKSKGLSQDDVVTNSNNLTKSTVSDVENGKRNFAFTTFLDLARGLNVSPLELIKYFPEGKD